MESGEEIALYCSQRHFSSRLRGRWLRWPSEDALALLALAQATRPSENHLREIMDWLEEINSRDGRRPAELLAEKRLVALVADRRVGRSDRLKRVKARLWRLRFPRLAARQLELAQTARELGLEGRHMRITFPASLEGDHLTVEISARGEAELRKSLERLFGCLEGGGFRRLFSLLHEV